MSAYQIIFRLLPIIFLSGFLNVQDVLGSPVKNAFTIDSQTTISFLIPNSKFYYSDSSDKLTDVSSLQTIGFTPHDNFTGFEPYRFYVKKIQIKNITELTRAITVMPGQYHLKSQFFLVSNKRTQIFNNRP